MKTKRIQIFSSHPQDKVNEVIQERNITRGNLINIIENEGVTVIWFWE